MAYIPFETEEDKHTLWHTSAHILAHAVSRLFPDAKFGIGPAIDNGFYYDIDVEHKFTEEDLKAIEKEMAAIVKEDLPLSCRTLDRAEARSFMEAQGERYKVELIDDLPEDEDITFYEQEGFTDLCAGPHLPSTGGIKAIKLLSTAGAYWRGSEKNKMLQRIYGVSFPKKSLLKEHLRRLEEAKKRDHRKVGREMDLFLMMEEGPGFPFFLPRGMIIRNELIDFWRKAHVERGYDEIQTPLILSEELWHTSGHWDHYKENMYFTTIDDMSYAIKPMNCPGSLLAFKRRMYSYRDFPMRVAELGQVHRHELSGALHGLMRVRTFTQDDAHLYMLPEQTKDELKGVIEFIDYVYGVFGFQYHIELSTRPENFMGDAEEWDRAEQALEEAMEELGMPYRINEGDGAFYGPKLDFHLEDTIGRTWQCGTIQLDFQMPQRFDISYIGPDGERHRPSMIHRTIFGSLERFIGILIEHFEGKFPLWLAPTQVKFLTVTEEFNEFADALRQRFRSERIRAELDGRNEKIGYKIREARHARDAYIVVIGQKEKDSGLLPVRSSKEGELDPMTADELLFRLQTEIRNKAY